MTTIRGLHRNNDGGAGGGNAADTAATTDTKITNNDTPSTEVDFEALTEGTVKTREEAQEFFKGFKDRYVPKAELEKYKDYIPAADAYPNEFSKEIVDLVKAKVPAEQIQLFVDLSTRDIKEMDSKEAIVKHVAMTEGLSMQDATLKVNSKFPSLDEYLNENGFDKEDAEDVEKAKSKYRLLEIDMRSEANKAKDFLLTKKKDIFQGIQSKQEVELKAGAEHAEKMKNLQSAWQKDTSLPALIETELKTFPFAFKDDDVDYKIDIPIPAEFAKGAVKEAQEYAMQNGIEPTADNVKKIVGQLKFAYGARNMEAIIKSVALDMRSKTLEEAKKGNAGVKPGGKGDGKGDGTQKDNKNNFYRPANNSR